MLELPQQAPKYPLHPQTSLPTSAQVSSGRVMFLWAIVDVMMEGAVGGAAEEALTTVQ